MRRYGPGPLDAYLERLGVDAAAALLLALMRAGVPLR